MEQRGLGFRDERVQRSLVSLTQKMADAKSSAGRDKLAGVTLQELEIYVMARIYEFYENGELEQLSLSPDQVDAVTEMAYWIDQSISD
jgi:hypothetical protein